MALLPFDQRDGVIWMDGQIVPWKDAKLHVLSHGLHYGGGVFEGERAYDGVIFKSRQHTERFFKSAELLDFEIPYSVDEIEAAKALVVKSNGLGDVYVRPVAWRGSEMMAVAAQNATSMSPSRRGNGRACSTSRRRCAAFGSISRTTIALTRRPHRAIPRRPAST